MFSTMNFASVAKPAFGCRSLPFHINVITVIDVAGVDGENLASTVGWVAVPVKIDRGATFQLEPFAASCPEAFVEDLVVLMLRRLSSFPAVGCASLRSNRAQPA